MKILIIGGAQQGKCSYALQKYRIATDDICDGATCAFESIFEKRTLHHLHILIRRLMDEGKDAQQYILEALGQKETWIIICDEVGCGIVPIDPADRAWREAVGRTCTALAQQADVVERVVCGIPQRIKGSADA